MCYLLIKFKINWNLFEVNTRSLNTLLLHPNKQLHSTTKHSLKFYTTFQKSTKYFLTKQCSPIQNTKLPKPHFHQTSFPQTQRNVLVSIASNIWGTKFQFTGSRPCLPDKLGSVVYKTSLLHLQPRQMTVSLLELHPRLISANRLWWGRGDFWANELLHLNIGVCVNTFWCGFWLDGFVSCLVVVEWVEWVRFGCCEVV